MRILFDTNVILQNLHPLMNISFIGGDMSVAGNPSLMSMLGLSGIHFIGGDFIIDNNEAILN